MMCSVATYIVYDFCLFERWRYIFQVYLSDLLSLRLQRENSHYFFFKII